MRVVGTLAETDQFELGVGVGWTDQLAGSGLLEIGSSWLESARGGDKKAVRARGGNGGGIIKRSAGADAAMHHSESPPLVCMCMFDSVNSCVCPSYVSR